MGLLAFDKNNIRTMKNWQNCQNEDIQYFVFSLLMDSLFVKCRTNLISLLQTSKYFYSKSFSTSYMMSQLATKNVQVASLVNREAFFIQRISVHLLHYQIVYKPILKVCRRVLFHQELIFVLWI